MRVSLCHSARRDSSPPDPIWSRCRYGEFVVLAQHDHISVCKPSDTADPAYARLIAFLHARVRWAAGCRAHTGRPMRACPSAGPAWPPAAHGDCRRRRRRMLPPQVKALRAQRAERDMGRLDHMEAASI